MEQVGASYFKAISFYKKFINKSLRENIMAIIRTTELIQFIGVDELENEDKEMVNTLANEYYDKYKTFLQNQVNLIVHVKCHDKEGNRKKYSIHARIISPTVTFESDKATDWDLARTLHKTFKNLENEIRHRLHTDVSAPKPRKPQK